MPITMWPPRTMVIKKKEEHKVPSTVRWVGICAPRSNTQERRSPPVLPVGGRWVVKLLRAYGGCSGNQCRGRTWRATIRTGEPHAGYDPVISEWGNPSGGNTRHPCANT